jgi:tRNA pseudouridine(38-40) synthase
MGIGGSVAPSLSEEIVAIAPKPEKMFLSICFGYLGVAFAGSSPAQRDFSPEDTILARLAELGVISRDAIHNLSSIRWSSALRPEAGAHCATQVLSMSIPWCDSTPAQICDLLNANDDPAIRVWSVIQTKPDFSARRCSDGERYTYVVPKSFLVDDNPSALLKLKEVVFREFVSAKTFQNYSSESRSACRLFGIEVGAEMLFEGVPLVPFHFRGAHLEKGVVRRIMTVVISVAKGIVTHEKVRRTLTEEKWKIPKAPACALVLDGVEYGYYMRRMRRPNPESPDVEFTRAQPLIEQWKTSVLFPQIARNAEDVFRAWITQKLGLPSDPVVADVSA